MSDFCVVVADASRARFFTLEPVEVPGIESGPRLVECSDLVDPEATLAGRDTWRDTRSGQNAAPGGGPSHRYDDHRDAYQDERSRRFARRISEATVELAGQQGARCVVLVAANRMLGFLRDELRFPNGRVEVKEVAKDLAPLSPLEIHRNLGAAGVLPHRHR